MGNQLQVALTVQKETLLGIHLLFLLFNSPLLTEHGLLSLDEVLLSTTLHLTSILLPVKDGHRVTNLFLLLTGFSHLALELFLGIELPKLGIHLLFQHLVFDVASLVNQLLLTLDGCTIVVEFGVFAAQGVILSLELHVLAACHFVVALLLTLGLQCLQALEHLFTDLLRRFQVVVEFLLINAILSSEKLCKSCLALLKVGSLAPSHVLNAVLDDVAFDGLASFRLPVGLVCQVVETFDVIHLASEFLKQSV